MKYGLVLIAVLMLGFILTENVQPDVFACSDKHKNPPDVQHLCKRLTKGQWWHRDNDAQKGNK